MEETGCAGVMIARGAMGDPLHLPRGAGGARGPSAPGHRRGGARGRGAAAPRPLGRASSGERTACVEFRKQFCSYTKGSVAGAALRNEAVRSASVEEFEALFLRWLDAAGGSGQAVTQSGKS